VPHAAESTTIETGGFKCGGASQGREKFGRVKSGRYVMRLLGKAIPRQSDSARAASVSASIHVLAVSAAAASLARICDDNETRTPPAAAFSIGLQGRSVRGLRFRGIPTERRSDGLRFVCGFFASLLQSVLRLIGERSTEGRRYALGSIGCVLTRCVEPALRAPRARATEGWRPIECALRGMIRCPLRQVSARRRRPRGGGARIPARPLRESNAADSDCAHQRSRSEESPSRSGSFAM
jgi:hypothetical protein